MARGKVSFNDEYCKGCELCISACPLNILGLKEKEINSKGFHPAYVLHEDQCSGCANCAMICPDNVITVYKKI